MDNNRSIKDELYKLRNMCESREKFLHKAEYINNYVLLPILEYISENGDKNFDELKELLNKNIEKLTSDECKHFVSIIEEMIKTIKMDLDKGEIISEMFKPLLSKAYINNEIKIEINKPKIL